MLKIPDYLTSNKLFFWLTDLKVYLTHVASQSKDYEIARFELFFPFEWDWERKKLSLNWSCLNEHQCLFVQKEDGRIMLRKFMIWINEVGFVLVIWGILNTFLTIVLLWMGVKTRMPVGTLAPKFSLWDS